MWKLKNVYVEGIVSLCEANLNIEQGVATLIFGRNEDNLSQPCNGSGKSSLVEAISFALTGEQLRKVKSIEEIINDNEDSAYVSVHLENDYDNTTFVIRRTISRGTPQLIECHKYDADGREIEKDKTVQPTVLDYNKFILNEIGLSKDDIYNNYILCDNKYESFFDCSDRSKKEIINRFSNGVIVDESIERVQKDMIPVECNLDKANKQVINIKGSISAIENELANVEAKKANAANERDNRIANIEKQILSCREKITEHEERKDKAEKRMATLNRLQNDVSNMECSNMGLIDIYKEIKSMCDEYELGEVSDFVKISEQYKEDLVKLQQRITELQDKLIVVEDDAVVCRKSYNDGMKGYVSQRDSYESLDKKDRLQINELREELDRLDSKLSKIDKEIKEQKAMQSELGVRGVSISSMISGAVKCPKCGHEFDVNNNESVDELKERLHVVNTKIKASKSLIESLNEEYENIDKEAVKKDESINQIEKCIKTRKIMLDSLYDDVHSMLVKVDRAESHVASLKRDLTFSQNDLDRINGKIEVLRNRLFGEITGLLEGRIQNGKGYIEQQVSGIEFERGRLVQCQTLKKELEEAPETDFETSLNESLKKYHKELKGAEKEAKGIQSEYEKLKAQEVYFTMFKSYIARKKIDALSFIINDFLEKIGSDIRLKLEGYTVTKTGKLRDKISVQVMRDGIDCGSYHKFSGGERARLNLACILSLHTLTNSNCEVGKGLDCIIIDELLDKSDEVGMATYCEALNKLKQTSLLITQGGVSEGYPHKLLVTKRQGVSTISK